MVLPPARLEHVREQLSEFNISMDEHVFLCDCRQGELYTRDISHEVTQDKAEKYGGGRPMILFCIIMVMVITTSML